MVHCVAVSGVRRRGEGGVDAAIAAAVCVGDGRQPHRREARRRGARGQRARRRASRRGLRPEASGSAHHRAIIVPIIVPEASGSGHHRAHAPPPERAPCQRAHPPGHRRRTHRPAGHSQTRRPFPDTQAVAAQYAALGWPRGSRVTRADARRREIGRDRCEIGRAHVEMARAHVVSCSVVTEHARGGGRRRLSEIERDDEMRHSPRLRGRGRAVSTHIRRRTSSRRGGRQ